MRAGWKGLALVAGLVASGSASAADPLGRAKPEDVGMSTDRLAILDRTLASEVERKRLPGAVLAVARRGKLVHYRAYGRLDPTVDKPMPLDGIFAIASMTKPLVGVALMMLQEEGKLSLNDPVEQHIPELGNRRVAVMTDAVRAGENPTETVPARRSITLLDLARHTSGITYGARGPTGVHKLYPASSNAAGETLDKAQFIQRLAAAPLLFQPGTVWDYSLSIDVLGLVVERASGQPLGTFLNEQLLRPLGMTDTVFQAGPDKAARIARAYPNDPENGKPQIVPDRSKPVMFECGGGCAASTAGDYLRFAQMLLNKGTLEEHRILGRKSVELMTSNEMTPDIDNRIAVTDPNGAGYGFGVTVAVRPSAGGGAGIMGSPGDFYWNGAYGTIWWADPKEELAVVFMAQTPGNQRREYRRLVNSGVYGAIVD